MADKIEIQHLLILGAAKSGTTLLTTMIGRHSEVGVLNEEKGWAMRKIVGKRVVGNKRCIPNQIELKRKSLFTPRIFKTWKLIREYQSSRYSIEDHLGLPNIRIIGLIRDSNDVISSGLRGGRKKTLDTVISRWCRAIEILDYLKERYPDVVLIVAFEDLVLNPEASLRRITQFLGLEFEDRMLEAPKYNPYYRQTKFNEAKVWRSQRENIDFQVERKFPSVYEKYRELLACSSKDQTAASPAGAISTALSHASQTPES